MVAVPGKPARRTGVLSAFLLVAVAMLAWHTAFPANAVYGPAGVQAPVQAVGSPSRSPYVAICLAVKDEHDDLPEWVEHHLGLGVGKIYVLDQGSQPPLSSVLGRYIAEGAVEYTWMEGVPDGLKDMYQRDNLTTFQPYAYDYCIERYRTQHSWIGMLDADEYIVLRKDIYDLPTFLKRYEQYGGLCAFWRVLGSSGHIKRPAGGVRRSFTSCQPKSHKMSRVIKSFVNTQYVMSGRGKAGPHAFMYRDDKFAVDSKYRKVTGHDRQVVHDEIEVYHYMLRSREEYDRKMERGNGMGWSRLPNSFKLNDDAATEVCTGALRYVTAQQ